MVARLLACVPLLAFLAGCEISADEPRLNDAGVDWTLGCISLLNPDVRDLYDLVPDGTLVLIED